MTGPGQEPKEPKKRSGLVVLFGCAGCGFLLLLIGVGGTMAWLLWRQNRGQDRVVAGWHDSLRVVYRLPALADRLAPAPAGDGDAAALLRGSGAGDPGSVRMRAARHLTGGLPLTAEDTVAIRGALRDSTAALAAAAARQSRYDATIPADSAGGPDLMPPLGPGLMSGGWPNISRSVDALILRGEARRWRGDLPGARADFAAVLALGQFVWRSEISDLGPSAGRRFIQAGAAGLKRVAAQSHDAVLAAQADSLVAWGTSSFGTFRLIGPLPPESLLVVAQDTTLPRGVRASALSNACWGAIYRPAWRLVVGPSGWLRDGVRALLHDGDPVVARAAEMADRTLARLDDMGMRNRFRAASGRSVR